MANELEKQLNDIFEEAKFLCVSKNKDYGNSFTDTWNKYGMKSAVIRLTDKINRLESIEKRGTMEIENESVMDTLVDIINYAALTVIELQNESEAECEHQENTEIYR